MSSCPECAANLQKEHDAGSPWNFCSDLHCQDLSNYIHSFCNCLGQFSVYPFVVNGVCMNSPGSLIPVADQSCYCCCDCITPDTQINISKDTVKTAHDFNVNDMVLVATDSSLKKWIQKPVLFSSGTGSSTGNRLLKIHFGDRQLIVPSGQPFLMQNGTMKQADKIIPGKDVLVSSDGSTIPVHGIESGLFKKGVHHIATSMEKAVSLDGHLLLANGVVIGDYATQIAMSTQNSTIEDKYKDHPVLGSKEYNQANTHLHTTEAGAFTKKK